MLSLSKGVEHAHAAELGEVCEHPIDAAHPGLLSMSCGSVKQAAAVRG